MKKDLLLLTTALIISVVFPTHMSAQTANNQFITITVPQKVIQDSLTRILPIAMAGVSDKLEGTITIVNISGLRIVEQKIIANIDLQGENLKLVTSVANQNIQLKLGNARINSECSVGIRYDGAKKIMYITPIAEGIDGEEALKKGDIGKALLLFLDGREFPIAMQNIKPLVAEAGNKRLIIESDIADIVLSSEALHLKLRPTISSSPKQ